jgi:hypothetical protein
MEVNTLIQRPPFNFYRASLTYFLILEYCKLFNPNEKGVSLSSVNKLWEDACQLYTDLNNERQRIAIDTLRDDELLAEIILRRNKSFAHSDIYDSNTPFKITVFTEHELDRIAVHLDLAIYLLNSIHKRVADSDLILPEQFAAHSLTRSFIYEASIAMAFYRKNMPLAYQQGFQMYQQRIVAPYAPHK